jgi:acyl-coenzyme A thioesterase PaaI-like protein
LLNDQLIATSELVKLGQRLIFMEAKVVNQNGLFLAKATAILNAYPKEKAGY